MKAGVSFSNNENDFRAGADAAGISIGISGDPVLMIVFTTDDYAPEAVLRGIKSVNDSSKIIGFCCGGIITDQGIHKQGVGICSLSGDFHAHTSLHTGLSLNPYAVGFEAGKSMISKNAERGTVIVLPDGFQANMSEMLRGLYNQMGPDFKYIGGGAGDNLKFFKTYQFTEKEIADDAVALAMLDGLDVGTGIGHGWKPTGNPLTITAVSGKIVYEIDNLPAFQTYSKRLGNVSKEEFKRLGMMHPLGFPDASGQYIIRDPLAVNEDDSINFVTEIPSQAVGNIMDCSFDQLIETASNATRKALSSIQNPSFLLLFDCISRILLMEDRFQDEIAAIRKSAGDQIPLLGALTFGEIGSYIDLPLVHNKTTVVAVGGDSSDT